MITRLKNHLFLDKHMVPKIGGVEFKLMYFEADDEIAYAWGIALKGELTVSQKEWFQKLPDHELGERLLMDQGIPYRYLESWDPINKTFSGNPKSAHEQAPLQPKYGAFEGVPLPLIED